MSKSKLSNALLLMASLTAISGGAYSRTDFYPSSKGEEGSPMYRPKRSQQIKNKRRKKK